jgi:hypothetical protein
MDVEPLGWRDFCQSDARGPQILRIATDIAEELCGGDLPGLLGNVISLATPDWRPWIVQCALHSSDYLGSWLYARGTQGFLIFDLAFKLLPEDGFRKLLCSILLSDEVLIPYDYRAAAGALWASEGGASRPAELARIRQAASQPVENDRRSFRDKVLLSTDGVDHLFDAHRPAAETLDLLRAASLKATRLNVHTLARRVLSQLSQWNGDEPPVAADSFVSPAILEMVAADLQQPLIQPTDYVAQWDSMYGTDNGVGISLAELLRVILLEPTWQLPDTQVRRTVTGFYRSVLKISSRALIGLTGGIFHVEHGTRVNPSFFYMGADAIIGKGCKIDVVGGIALCSKSFVGGGFIPLLIHTHKHLSGNGLGGSDERKNILPCIVGVGSRTRIPMHSVGLFEAADFLGKDSPYKGVSVHAAQLAGAATQRQAAE